MHTNTFCKYRKKLLASPRVHLVHFPTERRMQRILKKCIMDENDALSEYNKNSLGHNRTNGVVYSKIYFKVEICSAH